MSTLVVSLTLSMILSWEIIRPTMLTGEAGTILPTLLIGADYILGRPKGSAKFFPSLIIQ
jgi:hypothetical protein